MGCTSSSPTDMIGVDAMQQLESLKQQLAQKDAHIATLQKGAHGNAGGGSYASAVTGVVGPANVQALQQQVASLQQQLAAAQAAAAGKGGGGGGKLAEALFFPDPALPCRNAQRPGGCRRPNCTFSHEQTSLSRFLDYLQRAHKSLDICLFTITCDDISDVVVEIHRKGVKVRVITDNDQSATQGSDIGKFRDAGIEVRQDTSPTHMHHKFCIVDGQLLMGGSFNWTRQAVLGNQENVVILDNPALIGVFSKQFEKLWYQFKP